MTVINWASFSFPFFSQLQSTYLEVEVVMVVINNLLELFSIPKMMDSYFSTCNKNTFHAYRLFIVSGHDESITTFIDINPVLLFTWNKNIKRLKWRYIVCSYWHKKASVWSCSFNEMTISKSYKRSFWKKNISRERFREMVYFWVHTYARSQID